MKNFLVPNLRLGTYFFPPNSAWGFPLVAQSVSKLAIAFVTTYLPVSAKARGAPRLL